MKCPKCGHTSYGSKCPNCGKILKSKSSGRSSSFDTDSDEGIFDSDDRSYYSGGSDD